MYHTFISMDSYKNYIFVHMKIWSLRDALSAYLEYDSDVLRDVFTDMTAMVCHPATHS